MEPFLILVQWFMSLIVVSQDFNTAGGAVPTVGKQQNF
jgi:hypothetical protein